MREYSGWDGGNLRAISSGGVLVSQQKNALPNRNQPAGQDVYIYMGIRDI